MSVNKTDIRYEIKNQSACAWGARLISLQTLCAAFVIIFMPKMEREKGLLLLSLEHLYVSLGNGYHLRQNLLNVQVLHLVPEDWGDMMAAGGVDEDDGGGGSNARRGEGNV